LVSRATELTPDGRPTHRSRSTGYVDLPAPWRAAVDQAWESFVAGSLGIGAAVTDADGEVVVAGRNRVADADGPAGRLYGTRLAHAEMDVLAGLGGDRRKDLVLWTTLEPCLQCSGAILLFDLTEVRFAASDPLWHGSTELPRLNPFVADKWAPRAGPAGGALERLGGLLPLLWFLRARGRDHSVGRAYADRDPALLDLAVRLLEHGTPGGLVQDGADAATAYGVLTGN
jgi:tRNA(Arg) A34 adenosine deaminase TadA